MSSPRELKLFNQALEGLRYLEIIDSGNVTDEWEIEEMKALCRIDKRSNKAWAKALESLLLDAEGWSDHDFQAVLEISKNYFIKSGRMVYGWVVTLKTTDSDRAVANVARVLAPFTSRLVDKTTLKDDLRKKKVEHPTPRIGKGVPLRFIHKDDEHRSVRQLEADVRGNPIVPERYRVEEQPMAGMEDDYDRNSPHQGKGAFGMMSKPFHPPSGKGGKVGAAT